MVVSELELFMVDKLARRRVIIRWFPRSRRTDFLNDRGSKLACVPRTNLCVTVCSFTPDYVRAVLISIGVVMSQLERASRWLFTLRLDDRNFGKETCIETRLHDSSDFIRAPRSAGASRPFHVVQMRVSPLPLPLPLPWRFVSAVFNGGPHSNRGGREEAPSFTTA